MRTLYSTMTTAELLRIDPAELSSNELMHLCAELQERIVRGNTY